MKTLTQFLKESALPSTGDKELDKLLQKYEKSGRTVTVFPLKKTISLNGFRPISYEEAKNRLK